MVTSFLLLLLPLAAASGWLAAKRTTEGNSTTLDRDRFTQDYLIGLSYLLNEQPDKAVDTFIKMLEVDNETVETHLALGALFRRRGEVDRAIRIHQNLIARPTLQPRQRSEALLALGQDYLKAGVLDRAERLFLEVSDANADYKITALIYLLDIYQQQKQWSPAIETAKKLIASHPEMKINVAHYYCEMAQDAQKKKQFEQAVEYLQLALTVNPNCVRANLLLGAFEVAQGNIAAGLTAYQQVKNQDADYLSEAITPLVICYEQLDQADEIMTYFANCVQEKPQSAVILALTDLTYNKLGAAAAHDFLAKQQRKNPSIAGLAKLINLQLECSEQQGNADLFLLQDTVNKLLKNKPNYHCEHCGFTSKVLHWLCPGCKRWESVRGVH